MDLIYAIFVIDMHHVHYVHYVDGNMHAAVQPLMRMKTSSHETMNLVRILLLICIYSLHVFDTLFTHIIYCFKRYCLT